MIGLKEFVGTKTYAVVYADPPWQYKTKNPIVINPIENGSFLIPEYYYETMSLDEIKTLPVKEVSSNRSVCFLWATTPLLREALDVLEAWGFNYVTTITWHKTNCKGAGYWFRGHTEHLLFGKRGKLNAFRSLHHNIQRHKVGRHSEKPELFRRIIEDVTPHLIPKIELFARTRVVGWDGWGKCVSNNLSSFSQCTLQTGNK